jgi:hypothetical protein
VTYTTADGRAQLLSELAAATEDLAFALAALGEAYEHLDESAAERLEQELFRPVGTAYGRAQRIYAEFAARHELPSRVFEPVSAPAPSAGAKGLLESAVAAAGRADSTLSTLQDSMLPVEVGDPELRAGLRDIRELLAGLGRRSRELVRVLGR